MRLSFGEKLYKSRHLIPCVLLIVFIVWVMVIGWATATESAAYGVLGSLAIAWLVGRLNRDTFWQSLMGATRLSCMIMFILAGAAFLSSCMAFTGIPKALAAWVASLEPSKYTLIAVLAGIYILLGTALDGVSMIVLTTSIVIPMIEKAGIDLIWFGIFIVLLVEIAEVTAAARLQPVRAADHERQGQQLRRLRVDPVLLHDGAVHRAHHHLSRNRHLGARRPARKTKVGKTVITVHHLNNSRSQRILWLARRARPAYEVKRYQRDAKTMLAPPELRAVHPLGKSPVISDGDVTLAESGAIFEYLLPVMGLNKLVPREGTPERLRYTYWLHFAEGSMMPPLLLKLIFDRIENGPMPFFSSKPIARGIAQRAKGMMVTPNLERLLDFIEASSPRANGSRGGVQRGRHPDELSHGSASVRGGLDEKRAKSWAFLQKIHARPAYQRALEKGGKYELLR
jgi:glutathione S-transferase